MSDQFAGDRVRLYEYGEAHDDLRSAFYIDERSYADPDLARTVVETADAVLTRLGVIYSVEVRSGPDASAPVGVPTWEEFRQRHLIDGVPIPVRPRPRSVTVPPSWEAMNEALAADHVRFRDGLTELFASTFPDGSVYVRADHGPLRRSPGSINWSEETYGFEVPLVVRTNDLAPSEALDRLKKTFERAGWQCSDQRVGSNGPELEAERDGYRVWMNARPGHVDVESESPLYRSPTEPGSSFVVEPRRGRS